MQICLHPRDTDRLCTLLLPTLKKMEPCTLTLSHHQINYLVPIIIWTSDPLATRVLKPDQDKTLTLSVPNLTMHHRLPLR
jgi:hypothetical protein